MRMVLPLAALALALACSPADRDGDGFGEDVDCDDRDPEINPDAVEYCDGVDNDCDGSTDGPNAIDADLWFVDMDGDGLGDPERFAKACEEPLGWVANGDDDDDSTPG